MEYCVISNTAIVIDCDDIILNYIYFVGIDTFVIKCTQHLMYYNNYIKTNIFMILTIN